MDQKTYQPHQPFHFCLGLQQKPSPAAATGGQRLRPTAGITTGFLHSCYHGQSSLYWALLVTGFAVSGTSRSSRHHQHVILCIFHINVQDKKQTLLAWERLVIQTRAFPKLCKISDHRGYFSRNTHTLAWTTGKSPTAAFGNRAWLTVLQGLLQGWVFFTLEESSFLIVWSLCSSTPYKG